VLLTDLRISGTGVLGAPSIDVDPFSRSFGLCASRLALLLYFTYIYKERESVCVIFWSRVAYAKCIQSCREGEKKVNENDGGLYYKTTNVA